MVSSRVEPPPFSGEESHRARQIAESFGTDPESYDRTRPRYPDAMVQGIVAAAPGPDVLDVGMGTGIAARQFEAAGCTVLGVEVDERMAEFARATGLRVETARFEEWEPAGRTFDLVIAGQTWHWVDPVAGAAKAAAVLRPRGRVALFWNVFQIPADVQEAIVAVHRRVLSDVPFIQGESGGIESYSPQFVKAAGGIREAGGFGEPQRWRFDWTRRYTNDEWLDLVPTYGGYNQLPPGQLGRLLAGLGTAIDEAGGSFTMQYAAVVVTAEREHPAPG